MEVNWYWLINHAPVSRGTKFNWLRSHQNNLYRIDMCKYGPGSDQRQREDAENGWQYEFEMLSDEENSFYSGELLARARRLQVLTPPYYDDAGQMTADYRRSGITGLVQLTMAGRTKVRAAIREEEKYRSDSRARLIPYITALIGLVGAVSGLLAVLSRH